MLTQIKNLYLRDLNRLKDELEAYPTEEAMWQLSEGISNSGGHLALHLLGNLNHFIGARMGNTGYVREREQEFTAKVSRAELLAQIEQTKAVIATSLDKYDENNLADPYQIDFIPAELDMGSWLTYLVGHFNYHLGQINYHRRLISRNS